MSVPTCYQLLQKHMKARGRKLPTSATRDLAKKLSELQAETMSPVKFREAADLLLNDSKRRFLAQRRAANAMHIERLGAGLQAVRSVEGRQKPWKALYDFMVGDAVFAGDHLRSSTGQAQSTFMAPWLKELNTLLGKKKELAESGAFDADVIREMANLESGGTKQVGQSATAFEIAQAYNTILSRVFEAKSAYNPFLGKIHDYFFRATHSRQKISAVTREEWVAFTYDRFGEKSFPELPYEKKIEAFGLVYDNISNGTYTSSMSGIMANLKGGQDIFAKMSRNRTLIPNDWEAFAEYNEAFGRTDVHTTIFDTLRSAARDLAVAQKFGPDPARWYKDIKALLERKYPGEIMAKESDLDDAFLTATFNTDAPATSFGAKTTRNLMMLQQVAKNGAPALRSMPDLVAGVSAVQDLSGRSFLQNTTEMITEFWKAFGKDAALRDEEAADLFLAMRNTLGHLHAEFGDRTSGHLTRLVELHGHVTLANRYHSAMSIASATVISRQMSRLSKLDWKQLPISTQVGLRSYGMGEEMWNVVRMARETISLDGKTYNLFTAEGVRSIPDIYFEENLTSRGLPAKPRDILRARYELQSAIGAMLNDIADVATSTAGQKQKAEMFFGTNINSKKGMALRLILQFRTATMKAFNSMLRTMYSDPTSPRGNKVKIGRYLALTMALWGMQDTIRTLLQGKTPEDPTHPRYLGRAVAESGIGSLVGDTLMNAMATRSSSGQIASAAAMGLLGPTVGTGLTVGGILGQSLFSDDRGRRNFAGGAAGKLIVENIPFQNLFYTKALLNYAITNALREAMSPGYLGRLERNVSRNEGLFEPNQRYFMLRPTESFRP